MVAWMNWDFEVLSTESDFPPVGAVYIFTRIKAGRWEPLYVGKAKDLDSRMSGHEKWQQALSLGMAHVHVCRLSREADRVALEQALIDEFDPPLNLT